MLKFFNSNFRDLTHSLRIRTPFKPLAFSLFSQLHAAGDCSKLASLLSGLELEDAERKKELGSSRTTSFHGQEKTAQSGGDDGESIELGCGALDSSRISHPWPEWVGLMEMLVKRGYFDEIGNPFGNEEVGSGAKDSNLVRTACLNFGRDRVDLIRYLSRKAIRVIVGLGCPSLDRKVVNSGKRLRAYVGIDERNTCSSCSLRGSCDRAYVRTREDEVARTVDVMRILLTFGLDHTTCSVENSECQNNDVKESVRGMLKEIVGFCQKELDPTVYTEGNLVSDKYSSAQGQGQIRAPTKQGEWICPKCNFLNFARNIKCLRCNELSQDRLRKITEDQAQLPLKKGDWICEKCNFLNFAKNAKCLLCEEKPPKRQLGPGEWECDSCHYINFRKNQVCLRCDHRRPKASTSSNPSTELNNKSSDPQDGLRYISETDSRSLVRQGDRRQCNSWKFVDEKNEDRAGLSKRNVLEFIDFPILGGRSTLSRSEEKIEKWKSTMRERLRSMAKEQDKGNDSGFAVGPLFVNCTDDEDMEEWFGQVKDSVAGKQV